MRCAEPPENTSKRPVLSNVHAFEQQFDPTDKIRGGLENVTESLAKEFDIPCLSMGAEMGELGDGLDDLEINISFFSYAGS